MLLVSSSYYSKYSAGQFEHKHYSLCDGIHLKNNVTNLYIAPTAILFYLYNYINLMVAFKAYSTAEVDLGMFSMFSRAVPVIMSPSFIS